LPAAQAAITGDATRERVFQMRASDAILVGIAPFCRTIRIDLPPGMFERSPVRVVPMRSLTPL
jgi:riboflavin biosynthesis pyrimidine reductase